MNKSIERNTQLYLKPFACLLDKQEDINIKGSKYNEILFDDTGILKNIIYIDKYRFDSIYIVTSDSNCGRWGVKSNAFDFNRRIK